MSTRHDDDPVEHDPTGIRDILSRLPEPGPMPHDLVARISAALADEADGRGDLLQGGVGSSSDLGPIAHRSTTRSNLGGPDDAAGVLVLPRRPRWPVLGAAAAVVAVVGLGGLAVSTMRGGIEASMGMGETRAGSTGSGQELAPPGTADERPDTGATEVHLVATGTAYTSADLAVQARGITALSAGRPDDRTVPESADEDAADGVATPHGALTCARALGSQPWVTVVVDIATVDGKPAAVLVLTDSAGRTVTYAVARSCTTGAPDVVHGPLPLG
ncbi:MAG: hypothetical protein ACRCY8_17630 [Dermatophilaceae bacterium]